MEKEGNLGLLTDPWSKSSDGSAGQSSAWI